MFAIRRSGYTSAGEITLAIIKDLTENGFKTTFPEPWVPPAGEAGESFTVVLEAVGADLLNGEALESKQPWHMRIQVFDKYTMGISVGSPVSLTSTGTDSWDIVNGAIAGPVGVIGAPYTTTAEGTKRPGVSVSEGFINRKTRVMAGTTDMSTSFPMSYYLCTTEHGVFFSVWEDVMSVDSAIFSWVNIQRPVNRVTGAPIITGKSPVFAVYSVGNEIKRFIVRESDVLRPSGAVDATVDSVGFNAIINKEEQVAISESNKYIVNFPSRLNTQRYSYTYELDMIGYTGADVVSENNDIPLEVYGEERVYTTIHSNGPRNTKMRLVALKSKPAA